MSLVAIRSRATGKYLSLNGHGVSHHKNEGSGSVGLHTHAQTSEKFKLRTIGHNVVAFESNSSANVYLRFDAAPIKDVKVRMNNGGGIVNAQFGVGTHEQFHLKAKGDTGLVGIESKEFPGKYLRAAENTVNGQVAFEANEEFEIILLSV
ncbi:hypothetical protein CPB86DRAFT_787114 [Serendipita vermifera]|nr:hypothetical protein CPB86DRAFT_787114 [Serendipita vermifera]